MPSSAFVLFAAVLAVSTVQRRAMLRAPDLADRPAASNRVTSNRVDIEAARHHVGSHRDAAAAAGSSDTLTSRLALARTR
jgi:hypothetical protein